MAKATTAYDMLMETEHLFSETHWASGQFLIMDGYKPTLCAMGGIRFVAVGGLDFFNEVLDESKERFNAQLDPRERTDDPAAADPYWAPNLMPISNAIDDTHRFWTDPEYIRSLYCLMVAVSEQSGRVDPSQEELANDNGRKPYTADDYYKDEDQILSSAEEAIFAWNDADARRTEEVVAAFHRAAELANDKSFAPIPVKA